MPVINLHRATAVEPWPCEWECCTGNCTDSRRECLQPAEACTDMGADDDICRPPFNRATLAVLLFSGTGMAGVIGWAVLARLN